MDLKEQLEKITNDLEGVEKKKEKFFSEYESKKRKLLQKKKEIEWRIEQEHKEKILKVIADNFGEITEETMPAFVKAISSSTAEFQIETSGQNDRDTIKYEDILPDTSAETDAELEPEMEVSSVHNLPDSQENSFHF